MINNLYRYSMLVVLLICCIVVTGGCNSKHKIVPISGQVTIEGKPLQMGTVTVWVDGYRPAIGVIGKDGRFSLMTHSAGDGCATGEHEVSISSRRTVNEVSVEYFIPLRYGNPKTSELKINVDQPNDNWEINLTWKGDAHTGPYIVQ